MSNIWSGLISGTISLKPSAPDVWSSFFRHRTEDTCSLYIELRAVHRASVWFNSDAPQGFHAFVMGRLAEELPAPKSSTVLDALRRCNLAILEAETTIFGFPDVDCAALPLPERVALRDFLFLKRSFLEQDGVISEVLSELLERVTRQFITAFLPFDANRASPFLVPIIEQTEGPAELVESVMAPFFDEAVGQHQLCIAIRNQLSENLRSASRAKPGSDGPVTLPTANSLPASQLADVYLRGTPLLDVLRTPVPFVIRDRDYGEHALICASPGWGKTQLIQAIVGSFLERDDPPSVMLIDPTGAMISRIQRLAVFDQRLRDRILIIDPAQSPSLNMFDMSTPRFDAYSPEEKESIQSEIVGLFNYIFASEDYDLTSQMGLAFTFAVRLMLCRPGSTIIDLRKLLEEIAPRNAPGYAHSAYKGDIDRLDEDARDFFQHHFFAEALVGTRASIARRLHKLLGVPAFRRMFAASANALDLYSELQKGTIVLVNTSPLVLREGGHVLFGRYMIARALAAAYERAAIEPEQRKQSFLIIDEASSYTDDQIETLLTKVRQFKLGVFLTYQHLSHKELNDNVLSAVYGSTAVKFVGGANFQDRRRLAREMETQPEFIQAQRRDRAETPQWAQFACYVRNYTDQAISLTLPFYKLENMERMSDEAHAALAERNQRRVSSVSVPAPKTPEQPPAAPETPIIAPEPSGSRDAPQSSARQKSSKGKTGEHPSTEPTEDGGDRW